MIPVKNHGYPPGPVCFVFHLLQIPCFDAFLDRILYMGSQLDLTRYSRAELRGSDHRPGSVIIS